MPDETPDAAPTDWRGTPITEGALVIYGAPVGRSIALVEAEVVGFTKSGRVNLRVLRRAYGGGWPDSKDVVHVGADRLVVVGHLPPTEVPLMAEQIATRQERRRIYATHDFPPYWLDGGRGNNPDRSCRRCGVDRGDSSTSETECPA